VINEVCYFMTVTSTSVNGRLLLVNSPEASWLSASSQSVTSEPVLTKPPKLPLRELHWDDFERLCLRIARREATVEYCQLYGTPGQDQKGIDLYARKASSLKYTVYQCKRIRNFGPAGINKAIEEFENNDWVARSDCFVLCTSESMRSVDRAETIIQQNERLQATYGISLILWDEDTICEKLKSYPNGVRDFFSGSWAQVFCDVETHGLDETEFTIHSNNIPHDIRLFIGRDDEIANITSTIENPRVTTLTGAGGIGKTSLAIHICHHVKMLFLDGVWLVRLENTKDSEDVIRILANVIGIRDQSAEDLFQAVVGYLCNKKTLVVFDNCEHLTTHVREIVQDLISTCPKVSVIITSREHIHINGQKTFNVNSLSCPPDVSDLLPSDLLNYPGTRLFVECALRADHNFAVLDADAQTIADICRLVDGLPLAIELAAARVAQFSIRDLAATLYTDDYFGVLSAGPPSPRERHTRMEYCIDWSYRLLTETEKLVFDCLSVFRSGWTLEAAQGVLHCHKIRRQEITNVLTSLFHKSLIISIRDPVSTRYRMLEPVRIYAHNNLVDKTHSRVCNTCYANWYVQYAEAALPYLAGIDQIRWLDLLQADHDNFRNIRDLCSRDSEGAIISLRLCRALGRFYDIRGFYKEYRQWGKFEKSRYIANGSSELIAECLNWAGWFAQKQADVREAQVFHEESLSIFEASGNIEGIATSLCHLGSVYEENGEDEVALAFYNKSKEKFEVLTDNEGIADCLNNIGVIENKRKQYQEAYLLFQKSAHLQSSVGNVQGEARAIGNLAHTSRFLGEFSLAQQHADESLKLYECINDIEGTAGCLACLAGLAIERKDNDTFNLLMDRSESLYSKLRLR